MPQYTTSDIVKAVWENIQSLVFDQNLEKMNPNSKLPPEVSKKVNQLLALLKDPEKLTQEFNREGSGEKSLLRVLPSPYKIIK